MHAKQILKGLLPPYLWWYIKKICSHKWLKLEYENWSEAQLDSGGYDSIQIHNSVLKSALLVKQGVAAFERDSMLFYEHKFDWPIVTAVYLAAFKKTDAVRVIDFGGSLGSSYYQNNSLLRLVGCLDWCVIEQTEFVNSGNAHFADKQLHFFSSIGECETEYPPDLVIFSSVLQYLESPMTIVDQINSTSANYMLITRTPFISGSTDKVAIQNVPKHIYEASYPIRLFGYELFIEKVENLWEIIASGIDHEGQIQQDMPFKIDYRWMLLRRRQIVS